MFDRALLCNNFAKMQNLTKCHTIIFSKNDEE